MKNLVIYFVILLASLMLLGCGDKTKAPLALHNKLTAALEKEDFGFIFDSLTPESQQQELRSIANNSQYFPEYEEAAKTKSGKDLFVALCEKGHVINDVFKAEKIRKIEVNGDEAIIIVEGDPFPSMMIKENGEWKFKPKFHVLYGMQKESESSGDKQPSILDSSGDSESTSESEAPMTPDDQFELGRRYNNGIGIPKDEAEAVNWFLKAAEQGHAKAQYNLGVCYFKGDGVEENGPIAAEWFRKAAQQGLAAGQHNLGYFYENGITLPKDEAEALKLYRKAAEQNYANSQHSLGLFYLNGITLPKNEAEAVKWFRKAAEQGYADSQNNLGYIYQKGIGVTKDYVEAVKWYGKASEQGKAESMYNLGVCYSQGEGVPKDYVLAYKWLTICASGGNPKAISLRGTFEKSMSQEEIAEAQRLIREWNPSLDISNTRNSNEQGPKTANAPQQQTQSNNTEKSTPTPQSTVIGKPSKCGGVEVNVVTVDYSDSITGPLGNSNASDDATFVIVNWTYKNILSQPMNALNKPTMYLVSNENAKLKLDVGASATYATTLDNNEKILSDLNPGIKSETSSVFEVAKELFDPFTWKILVEHQNSQSWFTIRETEKTPSSIKKLIGLGESADFNGVSSKIDSIQTKNDYGSLLIAYAQPIEGSIFVEISWSIENRSADSIDSKELEIFLIPEDGKKYVAHRAASAISFFDEGVLYQVSKMIEPNTRLKRRDIFEVPKSKFKPSAWGLIVRRGDKDNWFSLIQDKPNQAQVEGTNGNAKPQSSGESVDSVANTPTDDARAELELEKIKLERERIELEREKLKMQNQSNSGPITNEPKIAADQIPATATSTGTATVPAMPGERYPETRLRLLGQSDLIDLNLNDLRYAINEMYARRGVVFKNVEIAKSFANKEWFKPRPGGSFEEIEKEFSAIEADNLKLLGKERERKAASADLYQLIDSESNLREGPGTNYPIVRKSRKGEVGEALSNKNGWMKLQFSDGSMVWAHEQNIKAAK